MRKKFLVVKLNGHVYMLRWEGNPLGARDAIDAWVNNPELEFNAGDKAELTRRLTNLVATMGH